MGKERFQVRIAVDDPSEHQGGVDEGALGEIADRIGELVERGPVGHAGVAALMEEEDGPQLLGGPEEGQEIRLVVGPAGNMIAEDHPFQTAFVHGALHLGDGTGWVLHRDHGQPGEAGRVLLHHLGDLVVALPVDDLGHLEFVVVLIETDRRGHQLHVRPQGVHLGQPLADRLVEPAESELPGTRVEAVPFAPGPYGVFVSLGRDVGVHVDHGHRRPPRSTVGQLR